MKTLRLLVVLATVLALTIVLAMPAMAAKNCWGVVTSQRAVAVGDIGEHSSSFAGESRFGLGNVARLFGFDHVSELGARLAELDGIDATTCNSD